MDVRFVEVRVPTGKRQSVVDVLDRKEIDYSVTDETSGRDFAAVVSFPLPTNAVEDVLAELRDVGVDEDARIVVVDAETVLSRRFEAMREDYGGSAGEERRIAREELETDAEELAADTRTFLAMTIASAVIATAGTLLNSPVIVVGANVIIPLMNPAMAASVGTIVRDQALFRRGVKLQVIGVLVAVASATLFAWIVRTAYLVPPRLDIMGIDQLRRGMSANFLSLVVALGAGVAGALSLTTGISSTIVGVAIAVALIPPTATLGIGVAWGDPRVVVGSGVLLLVNLLSINLAALATLWYAGYRPKGWFRSDAARSTTVKRVALLVVGIVVLSVFLGGVTYSTYRQSTFEDRVEDETRDLLSSQPYEELDLVGLQFEYDRGILFREPTRVVVTVGGPGGEDFPSLPDAIRRRIAERTGTDVTVEVRFVEIEVTRPT